MVSRDWIKIIFTILTVAYFSYSIATPDKYHFLSGASLIIHEVGHILASFLPLIVAVVAGTAFELFVTCSIIIYFAYKKQYYSSFFVMLFLGLSLSYTSWYIADSALKEGSPFINWGGNSIHDWEYILGKMGQLNNSENISLAVRFLAIVVTLVASIGSIWLAFKKEKLLSFN